MNIRANKPVNHGPDHLPGGQDPIPFNFQFNPSVFSTLIEGVDVVPPINGPFAPASTTPLVFSDVGFQNSPAFIAGTHSGTGFGVSTGFYHGAVTLLTKNDHDPTGLDIQVVHRDTALKTVAFFQGENLAAFGGGTGEPFNPIVIGPVLKGVYYQFYSPFMFAVQGTPNVTTPVYVSLGVTLVNNSSFTLSLYDDHPGLSSGIVVYRVGSWPYPDGGL